MKIAINAVLSYVKPRGVGVYFDSFITQLAETDDENEYFIFYGDWMQYQFCNIKRSNFHLIPLRIPRGRILRNLFLTFRFPFLLKKYRIDLLHNIDTTPILFRTTPIVSTIHDLSEFFLPEKYGKIRSFIRRSYVRGQIKRSDLIMTPSQFSKDTIVSIAKKDPKRIIVVPNSVSFEATKKHTDRLNKNLLFVGEIEKTKNIEAAVSALPFLPEDYRLVIVGKKGNDYEELVRLIVSEKVANRVEIKGYLSNEELNALYDSSYLFVFPSLYEGFGIPIIEAMAHGLPVLSSDATCLPEVGGEACLFFDPHNPKDLAEKVLAFQKDDELYQELVTKGFSRLDEFTPQKMAAKIVAVYQMLKGSE